MKRNLNQVCKSLVLGGLAFCFVIAASAQEQQNVSGTLAPKIGVKGGLNFSNLYVEDVQSENMKLGFNLGLFAKVPVTRGFSIQPEVLYSTKGSKIGFLQNFGGGEYLFNLNYIEVPLLAVINLGRNFNIHAGPYASYLTSVNIKQEDGGLANDDIATLDADDFNRLDYGLAGGLGFDVRNFTIGARYNYGLKEVGKSNNFTSSALRNSKNSVFNVYVGFGF